MGEEGGTGESPFLAPLPSSITRATLAIISHDFYVIKVFQSRCTRV